MNIEEIRVDFESWHREKYKTKHQSGRPTRDMHNGVYAEQYGPEDQQERWEAWQASAEVARNQVEAEAKRSAMRLKELDLLFGRQLMIMRAAVIEMEHGYGHEGGMKWIFDQLLATGQFAPQDATNAGAYFEQEMKPIDAGLAEVFAYFHPQYADKSEALKRPRNDACCGCVNAGHSGQCAAQEVRQAAENIVAPSNEVVQLKTENDELRATVDLQKLLPEIRGVLKDLELRGFRCDQSFRKLKDWYRKVGLAYRVIQGPMFGAEHGELVSQNTWLRSIVEHYAQQHAPLEPIPDSDGWSTRLPGYDLPALLRDAERYRWLRDKSGNHRGSYSPIPIQQNPDGSLSMIDGQLMSVCDENLDDDIDAAMSKAEQ